MAAAAAATPPRAGVLLFGGVPVDSPGQASTDWFSDSDDEEPAIEHDTPYKWDEFILRTPDENAGRGLRKLRKAGGMINMMASIHSGPDTTKQEIEDDFALHTQEHGRELARSYRDGAVDHLGQLLAEIREFGLCDDPEDGVRFPEPHANVAEEMATAVAAACAEELERFKQESMWTADKGSGPQVEVLLKALREFNEVQVEQVAFVTEQTARWAHIAKVNDMEKKVAGFRTVAVARQSNEVQQLWADWQLRETTLLTQVGAAEEAARLAVERATTARRMFESAEEKAEKKQGETSQINKVLNTEATIVAQRNRMLEKEKEKLEAEARDLESRLAGNVRRYDVLMAQREASLDRRARGTSGRGAARDRKTETGATQALADAAAHLAEMQAMKARVAALKDGQVPNDSLGLNGLSVSVDGSGERPKLPPYPSEMSYEKHSLPTTARFMMNYALKMMKAAFKVMNFVLKTMNFVIKFTPRLSVCRGRF